MTATADHAHATADALESLASQVTRRVLLRRWLSVVEQCWVWAAVGIATLVAAHWAMAWSAGWAIATALLWLAGTGFVAWRQRPDTYSALALWDSIAGRSETLAAAWWFQRQPTRTSNQQRHIEAQQSLTTEAAAQLSQQLPLRVRHSLLVPLALLGLLAFSPWQTKPTEPDEPLTEAMGAEAKTQAQQLANATPPSERLQGLKPDEKAAVEQLRKDLQQTAKSLAEGTDGKSARDVLSDLERRANEAEKLAEKLGAKANDWASAALIEQLRRHADTADLGDAVAAKNAATASAAAKSIAEQLQPPQLSEAARTRFTDTLNDVAKDSEDSDRQRLVGSHVLAAGDKLTSNDAAAASAEFQALADTLANQAQRDKAREQMQQLAQQLRDAGSRIAGQQNGAMQAMQNPAGQQQQQQGQAGQMQPMQTLSQQPNQGTGQPQQMQMLQQAPQSGSPNEGQQGQSQQLQMASPDSEGKGKPGEASGQGQRGKPMLVAPDPTKKPDDQPSQLFMAQGEPPPGGQAMQMQANGMPPGQGTTNKLTGDQTRPNQANDSSTVKARANGQGPSSIRRIEGGLRDESASRAATATPADFIKQEEAALDDSTLPPARREQVRRYFNQLRQRFEPKGR